MQQLRDNNHTPQFECVKCYSKFGDFKKLLKSKKAGARTLKALQRKKKENKTTYFLCRECK
jgi:hypothetical protein